MIVTPTPEIGMKNARQIENEAERVLWKSFQEGDDDAFAKLYQQYIQVIYNYGRKFSDDQSLIEDCIHSLFVDLWNNRETISLPISVRFYLYASIKRRLHKEMAKKKVTSVCDYSILEAVIKDSSASAEDQMIHKQQATKQQKTIMQSLSALSENQRRAILLKYYKDLSFQEIAKVMGMSTENIYKLVSRGVAMLKKNLQYQALYN
ncbi:RNA polymerase sigma factor [Pontibacter harenae]|uniref:RNA polymerase sigma factor n=1 Tax=Pontibacter harenae TaxID=2894083 RepID=UPI001E44986F|nr:sigma-70 family RNA polymerase sigma factor [Pontibacter harenae]MCC9168195.1 sigma-70 family RNA polymerase sigma factor [Pontibacter harenae]